MSEGRITLANTVIVTRGTGRYYITKERGDKIIAILNSENCPKMLKIDDNFIASNDIVGVVSALQVEEMEMRRRGLWQCGHGKWWPKEEKSCKCGWGMSNKKEVVEVEQTPEQRERSALLVELIKQKKFPKNIKGLSNDDLRKMIK